MGNLFKRNYLTQSILIVCSFSLIIITTTEVTKGKYKRQLFRENVLPQQGGKIPDQAFTSDRISLNRLHQYGLFNSDGLFWDHSQSNSRHHPHKYLANTIKITVPPNNRFLVAPEGQYHWHSPHTVDTTYIIREPVSLTINPPIYHRSLPLIPYSSLKLLYNYKSLRANSIPDTSWKNVLFNSDDFPVKILAEFAPYLQKIHETDCD